jgi:hypothetical protein
MDLCPRDDTPEPLAEVEGDRADEMIEGLASALEVLYQQYVVDMHGENVCDCDPSVDMHTCAPCLARHGIARAKEWLEKAEQLYSLPPGAVGNKE